MKVHKTIFHSALKERRRKKTSACFSCDFYSLLYVGCIRQFTFVFLRIYRIKLRDFLLWNWWERASKWHEAMFFKTKEKLSVLSTMNFNIHAHNFTCKTCWFLDVISVHAANFDWLHQSRKGLCCVFIYIFREFSFNSVATQLKVVCETISGTVWQKSKAAEFTVILFLMRRVLFLLPIIKMCVN